MEESLSILLLMEIKENLEDFLSDRTERFPNISEKQKEEWSSICLSQIVNVLEDSDFYYDNVPDSVVEK